jgi:hypothetical protein
MLVKHVLVNQSGHHGPFVIEQSSLSDLATSYRVKAKIPSPGSSSKHGALLYFQGWKLVLLCRGPKLSLSSNIELFLRSCEDN